MLWYVVYAATGMVMGLVTGLLQTPNTPPQLEPEVVTQFLSSTARNITEHVMQSKLVAERTADEFEPGRTSINLTLGPNAQTDWHSSNIVLAILNRQLELDEGRFESILLKYQRLDGRILQRLPRFTRVRRLNLVGTQIDLNYPGYNRYLFEMKRLRSLEIGGHLDHLRDFELTDQTLDQLLLSCLYLKKFTVTVEQQDDADLQMARLRQYFARAKRRLNFVKPELEVRFVVEKFDESTQRFRQVAELN